LPKSLKKILPWAVLILLLYIIIHNPGGTATSGHHLGSAVASAAGHIADFVTSLFAGR
jgi:hypothetical protein